MIIDPGFNFHTDSREGDSDSTSPTLRKYHKILWSNPLPNGKTLDLSENQDGAYLYNKSELGEFFFGSDAITHSYKSHKRKQWLTEQIPDEVNELFDAGSQDESQEIKFYLPFDNFDAPPVFSSIDEYLSYKNGL